jgi:ABC-2 type transport system ATP-binding protein
MRELKGETTVFYSTHILDDVQRVSDHVAILDHGRLVKAAPTQVLLSSFTQNVLRVSVGDAGPDTSSGIRAIPGVASVALIGEEPGRTTYDVSTREGAVSEVQRAITRFAVDAGLTLISNQPETLDLESVFLRFIDQKEVAA